MNNCIVCDTRKHTEIYFLQYIFILNNENLFPIDDRVN